MNFSDKKLTFYRFAMLKLYIFVKKFPLMLTRDREVGNVLEE